MKVKKLSFDCEISGYYESTNKAYDILKITENFEARFGARSIGEFDTFKEAQEACQKHFESFILSQIEPDHNMVDHDIAKPFDPTLIGFDLPEKINDGLIIYSRHDNLGIFNLCKALTRSGKSGKKEYWFLIFKDSALSGFPNNDSEPILKGVVIDNHDFGVQLISQFLGEKTDAN